MTSPMKMKICFDNGTIKKFELSQHDFEKFLAALNMVTADSFILNGISVDPKEIESIWTQVYPVPTN